MADQKSDPSEQGREATGTLLTGFRSRDHSRGDDDKPKADRRLPLSRDRVLDPLD